MKENDNLKACLTHLRDAECLKQNASRAKEIKQIEKTEINAEEVLDNRKFITFAEDPSKVRFRSESRKTSTRRKVCFESAFVVIKLLTISKATYSFPQVTSSTLPSPPWRYYVQYPYHQAVHDRRQRDK